MVLQLAQLQLRQHIIFNVGDIVLFDSVTLPGGTGYTAADFEDKNFQVISVPSPTTFTITQSSNATGTVATRW